MPAGFLVYCTALASARNSRCRLIAACISLPKKVPIHPITIKPIPKIAIPAVAFSSVFLVLGPNIVDLRTK